MPKIVKIRVLPEAVINAEAGETYQAEDLAIMLVSQAIHRLEDKEIRPAAEELGLPALDREELLGLLEEADQIPFLVEKLQEANPKGIKAEESVDEPLTPAWDLVLEIKHSPA
jgi:hypothetical protein